MPTVKTELEWPYNPADFFEAPYRSQTDTYAIVVDAGTVRVTLATPLDPIDPRLQDQITKHVQGIFSARQLLVHRQFQLEYLRVCQHRSDDGKETSIGFAAEASFISVLASDHLSTAEQCDVAVHNAAGRLMQDSKSARITEHTKFIDSVASKVASSATLNALLQSYNAAVADPANELAHLYEIRDALAKHYGTDAETRRKLAITEKDWKRLGYLANEAPLNEGRHRGRHSNLRNATLAELDDARRIARELIVAFANQV
jgi:hypothetical protein